MTEAEPNDLEEGARLEQLRIDAVTDLWDDGLREVEAISKQAQIPVPEVRRILIERKLTTFEGEDQFLRIRDVSAEHMGRAFLFDVEVIAVDGAMTLPTRQFYQCARCGQEIAEPQEPREFIRRKAPQEPLECYEEQAGCKRSAASTKFKLIREEVIDYAILTVSDLHEAATFADGGEDARMEAYLVGLRPPLGGRVRLRATVINEGLKTRKLALITEEFRELEGRPAAPKMTPELVRAFTEIGLRGIGGLRNQVAPDMVGRPLVQEAILLTLVSATRIPDVNGKEIRGSLIAALVGDTTTNKTEAAKDAVHQVNGEFIDAGNARRTGLTHTITERAAGGWRLEWGLLVRAHGKFATVDGLEKWSSEMQGDLRGVMRDQEVRVEKVVHGSRKAAVRMLITVNPGGEKEEKPVSGFPFRCAAVPATRPFAKGPDIARVDLWLVLAREDVSADAIAKRGSSDRPLEPRLFLDFIYWCWSRAPSDYSYLPAAAALLREDAAGLMEEFGCSKLPIVHSGFLEVVCRVSAAFANFSFSSPDGSHVVIAEDHVREAADFLRRMCEAMELRQFKAHVEEDATLTGADFLRVIAKIDLNGLAVVTALANNLNEPMSAKEIAEALGGEGAGWTKDAVDWSYRVLEGEGLIELRRGLGAFLTPRGIGLFRQASRVSELFRGESAEAEKVSGETPRFNSPEGGDRKEASAQKRITDAAPIAPAPGDGGALEGIPAAILPALDAYLRRQLRLQSETNPKPPSFIAKDAVLQFTLSLESEDLVLARLAGISEEFRKDRGGGGR